MSDSNKDQITYDACKQGDINTLQNFINSEFIQQQSLLSKKLMLRFAVENEHSEVVNFLITSFKEVNPDDTYVVFASKCAISMSKLDILKSIVHNFKDDKHFNMELIEVDLMEITIKENNLSAFDYLFKLDNWKNYIHNKNKLHSNLFITAYSEKQFDILKYLVFDCEIKLTKRIEEYIQIVPSARELFELRDLKQSLTEELSNDKQNCLIKNLKI